MTAIGCLFRCLRKRWVLGLILMISFIYFLASMSLINLNEKWAHVAKFVQSEHDQNSSLKNNMNWRLFFNSNNGTALKTCRNSVQGKVLIADERGYLCQRSDVQPGGCCNAHSQSTTKFNCKECNLRTGCCSVYEHCISCCLLPDKQLMLKNILRKALETYNPIYSSVTDHFELCLTKCRTSSRSVQHENTYKDPKFKHCYKDQITRFDTGWMILSITHPLGISIKLLFVQANRIIPCFNNIDNPVLIAGKGAILFAWFN